MPSQKFLDAFSHHHEGGRSSFFDQVNAAVQQNLGKSGHVTKPPTIGDFQFPAIPEGSPTTIIPIAFPITSTPPPMADVAVEEGEIAMIFVVAAIIWALPTFIANSPLCFSWFRRCVAKHIRLYFLVGLIINLSIIGTMVSQAPHISVNDIFFTTVKIIGKVSDQLQDVLSQLLIVFGGFMAFGFRKKIISLLGFDASIVRCGLRDLLTCFSMKRFRPIEISIWKMEGLKTAAFSRSVFVRIVLGSNEPLHSRPHNGCTDSVAIRENLQLNYDPEDHTQKLTITLKQQEIVGGAVSQLAPAVGAIGGGLFGLMQPFGPVTGAGLGAVTGIGAANSVGVEIARVDLSATMINKIREIARHETRDRNTATRSSGFWNASRYTKVDLVPQGECWLRISDLE